MFYINLHGRFIKRPYKQKTKNDMEELKFKTTLKCGGCEEKVTPGLNAIDEIEEWDVDLDSADKILTVFATKNVEDKIIEAVEKVGFEIEKL